MSVEDRTETISVAIVVMFIIAAIGVFGYVFWAETTADTIILMEASRKGTLVVMLLPARTDTRWFQQFILNRAEVRFLKGRLRFETNGIPGGPAPFPSMIVVMRTGER